GRLLNCQCKRVSLYSRPLRSIAQHRRHFADTSFCLHLSIASKSKRLRWSSFQVVPEYWQGWNSRWSVASAKNSNADAPQGAEVLQRAVSVSWPLVDLL